MGWTRRIRKRFWAVVAHPLVPGQPGRSAIDWLQLHDNMNFRRDQYEHFGDSITWLSPKSAVNAYESQIGHSSTDRYGLNHKSVTHIEQCNAAGDSDLVDQWLSDRCTGTELRVIFGPDSVFDTSVEFMLANWRDVLCPSTDDALIVSLDHDWLMFYCHEDEFEFGRIDATIRK